MKLRLRRFAAAPLLTLTIAMLAMLAPASAAAASQIRFGSGEVDGLRSGSNCIHGRATPSVNVNLAWRSSGGGLKAKGSVLSSAGGGFWTFCSTDARLAAGDLLKAGDGSTQRQFTLPLVTLKVDRVANEFRGRAPANSNLTLWSHSAPFSDFYERNDFIANANGRWQFDDGQDIPGGSDAYLDWVSAKGDSVTAFAVAPQINVTVGRAEFTGYANPGQEIRLVLRDNATDAVKAIGETVAEESGFVRGDFRNPAGHRVPVSVGDRVVARQLADDLNWNVPHSEATADVAADTVSGACHDFGNPSQTAIVEVHRTGQIRGFAIVGLDATGHFEVDFGEGGASPFYEPANIKHGDRIVLECMLGTGDWVRRAFLVP